MGKSTISMAIFNSYVSSLEGIWIIHFQGISHDVMFDNTEEYMWQDMS